MTDPASSSSPKSSILSSSPQPSASTHPHLHAFQRRFHSKPPAQPISSEDPPDVSVVTAPVRNEAVRNAKQFLSSNVRDDWSYPQAQLLDDRVTELREPLDYRHREEGPSDLDNDTDEPDYGMNMSHNESNPYRFESPDAIGSSMLDRRRKRRKVANEEMQWNEGLQIFAQRRDAWTCAVQSRPKLPTGHDSIHTNSHHPSVLTDVSSDWPLSSESQASRLSAMANAGFERPSDLARSPTNNSNPFLPVYPPLLPISNPVRSSIKPLVYPVIYSKVVIQGLTPTVPIPLPHMVAAMVQGWKAEGNWPPKNAIPGSGVGNGTASASTTHNDGLGAGARRHAHNTMLRFKRAHGLANGSENGEREKGRVRKGVGGAMRKALGLKKDDDEEEVDEGLEDDGMGIRFEDQTDRDQRPKEEVVYEEKPSNTSDAFRVS